MMTIITTDITTIIYYYPYHCHCDYYPIIISSGDSWPCDPFAWPTPGFGSVGGSRKCPARCHTKKTTVIRCRGSIGLSS